MIIFAQLADDGRAHTLINQKSHLNGLSAEGNKGCILEGLGGKEETGKDIVLHQAGIFFQNCLHTDAMSQKPQDVLHGEPGASDDWFAHHYLGVYGYPFQ